MSAPLLGSHLSTPPFFRPGSYTWRSNSPHYCPRPQQVQALGAGYFFEHLMSDSLPALQSSIAAACLSAALHHAGFGIELLHRTSSSESLLPALQCSIEHARLIMVGCNKLVTLLDLCVSSLRRGHANLLCIVPILTDDPRRESRC